jgi:hypothetical protein
MECVNKIRRGLKCNHFGLNIFACITLLLLSTISQCTASDNLPNSIINSTGLHDSLSSNNLFNLNGRSYSKSLLRKLENFVANNELEIVPGVYIKEKKDADFARSFKRNDDIFTSFNKYLSTYELSFELGRANAETGRLFFFKGKFINVPHL